MRALLAAGWLKVVGRLTLKTVSGLPPEDGRLALETCGGLRHNKLFGKVKVY
jgi:hypothetical protein